MAQRSVEPQPGDRDPADDISSQRISRAVPTTTPPADDTRTRRIIRELEKRRQIDERAHERSANRGGLSLDETL